jgi:hypothetical protein
MTTKRFSREPRFRKQEGGTEAGEKEGGEEKGERERRGEEEGDRKKREGKE